MTLTEFLLARIAEDKANIDGDWAGGDGGLHIISTPMHDRMVNECEAKRHIVEAFQDAERAVATYDHDNPTDAYWQEWGNRHALELVVQTLAATYADHPDYMEAWRP